MASRQTGAVWNKNCCSGLYVRGPCPGRRFGLPRAAFARALAAFLAFVPLADGARAAITERINLSSGGTQANADSVYPAISADGRVVAFCSGATNLVSKDGNRKPDVFARERATSLTTLVSVSSSGVQGKMDSNECAVSADGRFVAFCSSADNLVPGDTNGQSDVFVRDRLTGVTERVSVNSAGEQGNEWSGWFPVPTVSISASGQFVAFTSHASNLVAGDTNGKYDVFVRDRTTDTTERVSVSSSGAQGDDDSWFPSISADGRCVAFSSYATSLVPGDTNGKEDVFVRDRVAGITERVSITSSGGQASDHSRQPSISGDGRLVAFMSYANNLAAGDAGHLDVFIHNRDAGLTECVSVSSSSQIGNADSNWPSVSADGRWVAFASAATNLVSGDTNATNDVFVHDCDTGLTERVSLTGAGEQGNGWSDWPSISGDGRFVAFRSWASNLVPTDTNGFADIFVRDRGTLAPGLSINAGAACTNSTAVTLSVTCGEWAQVRFRNDPGTWGAWEACAATKAWGLLPGDGIKKVCVQGRDAAFNESAESCDQILLDTSAPSDAGININSGASCTNSPSVTLSLSATDAGEMRVRDDPGDWGAWEPYATSKAWTLPPGDAAKTVCVQYRDACGNMSAGVCDSITLDTAAPSAPAISINGGASCTNSTSVTLSVSCPADCAGIRFRYPGGTWTAWESCTASRPSTLTTGDGLKTICAQCRDACGNIGAEACDDITLDTTAPSGASISINAGAACTNSLDITLSLSATGPSEMRVRNYLSTWGAWEAYATSTAWTLAAGDGSKTVCVQYRDTCGNMSAEVCDSITLDTTAPTGAGVTINAGASCTTSTGVTLTLSATSAAEMRLRNDPGDWGTWQTYAASKSWTLPSADGPKRVCVQYRDACGNVTGEVCDDITLDTTAPSAPTISINAGAACTNSLDITLSLSATGPSEMRVRNYLSTWGAWEPYATTKPWTLPSGDGSKTVCAQYRDACGNLSSEVCDSITLDTTPPTGAGVTINAGAACTNSASVTLSPSATGALEMRLRDSSGSYGAWETYAASKAWTLPSGDGTKTVCVQYRDGCGNVTSEACDDITLDTTPPSAPSVTINGGAACTTLASVTLTISCPADCAAIRFKDAGGTWTAWQSCTGTRSWTLPAGDGLKMVCAQCRDACGNIGPEGCGDITLDTTAPGAPIISINGGAANTNSTSVMLTIACAPDCAEIRFRNDAGDWGPWEQCTGSKPWTLPAGDGTKRVCAQCRDACGIASAEGCDEIILDTALPDAPGISIAGSSACAASTAVTLTISCPTGCAQIRFRNDPGDWGPWEACTGSKAWALPPGDGIKRVCAQCRDASGNLGAEGCDEIVLDTAPPSGVAISINGGAVCAVSPAVTLTLAAAGAVQMRFRNEAGAWSSWEPYATTKAWSLSAGRGMKTVGFQCRDGCGNLSAEATDAIPIPTFDDVACANTLWPYAEALVREGIASGCSAAPPLYCPAADVTRAQMAKFLCLAAGKAPLDSVVPTFADVPKSYWAYGYIERLADAASWPGGVAPTNGCRLVGTTRYFCPFDSVTREQMAKFLCLATSKSPMASCSGIFADVPSGSPFCPFIERLAYAASWPGGVAVTSGCACPPGYPGGARCYCPKENCTRAQMAKFLVLAFGIPL
jgi:hypothetical protein